MSQICYIFCLIELMWIQDRMLAAKNMNANKQTIFCEKVDLKNESDVKWLHTWSKRRPTIFLNIIQGTIQQLTENNESDLLYFLWMILWNWNLNHGLQCLKLVNVTLFENLK